MSNRSSMKGTWPFCAEDYLSPLAVPTGKNPDDVLNIIWRKNEVFLDVGSYNVGAGFMVLWVLVLMFSLMGYYSWNANFFNIFLVGASFIIGVPFLILVRSLCQPVSLPFRFNRQRRQVWVPCENGDYWVVPWETVEAIAAQQSIFSPVGRSEFGMLFVGFNNPDDSARENNRHQTLGFNCGCASNAVALWECIRSYMEIGPDAVPDPLVGLGEGKQTQINYLLSNVRQGNVSTAMYCVFCIFFLGTYFAEVIQNLKLSPPPDLPHPEIIEWSKPLPPEQWAKRSPELEVAIAQREAELGINTACEVSE